MSLETWILLTSQLTAVAVAWGELKARLERIERAEDARETLLLEVRGILAGTASAPGLVARVSRLEGPAPALPAARPACDSPPDVPRSGRSARR